MSAAKLKLVVENDAPDREPLRDPRTNPAIPVYHDGVKCPACTGNNWLIGRSTAECARCTFALILSETRCGGEKVIHKFAPGCN